MKLGELLAHLPPQHAHLDDEVVVIEVLEGRGMRSFDLTRVVTARGQVVLELKGRT